MPKSSLEHLVHDAFYHAFEPHSDSFRIPQGDVFEDHTCEFDMPVPSVRGMRGYGPDPTRYLQAGKINTERMFDLVDKAGKTLSNEDRILDFGCGAGRMTRWLRLLGDSNEYWGCDVWGPDVFWAKEHLGDHFNFFTNVRVPHLPLEDNYFDFVIGGSMFSHFDDIAEAWFLELRRVTRPGGFLFLSVLDEHAISVLVEERKDHLEQDVLSGNAEHIAKFYEYVASGFDMFSIRRAHHTSLRYGAPQTFCNSEYLRNKLDRYFEVAGYEQQAYGYQSAVILKKRDRQ